MRPRRPPEDAARQPAPTRARQADLLSAPAQVLGAVDRPAPTPQSPGTSCPSSRRPVNGAVIGLLASVQRQAPFGIRFQQINAPEWPLSGQND